jgi:mRNA interferase RelE/StbE
MYKITFSKQADKALRKMPRDTAFIITEKIKGLAKNPKKMKNVKKLTDYPGYRMRVGDWWVVYTVKGKEVLIHIVKIKS